MAFFVENILFIRFIECVCYAQLFNVQSIWKKNHLLLMLSSVQIDLRITDYLNKIMLVIIVQKIKYGRISLSLSSRTENPIGNFKYFKNAKKIDKLLTFFP